jgi:2-isopropylmalate synthase
MSNQVHIFDTTLRDGEQSPGATMNQQEKVRLARQLESLGVAVIEAGFPAASQGDFQAVKAIAESVDDIQVAGLCRAMPGDIDRAWEAVKGAKNPRIHTFLATSDIHMEFKLNKTREQVLEIAENAVRHAAKYTANVEFSAEDASRSDWEFLAQVAEVAIKHGATTINMPDTVGYAQPHEYADLIRYLLENVKDSDKAIFSVHCHNDLGLAVANTLAALKAGARQAEVTLSGIGERAGNAALEQVVMSLATRPDLYSLETGVNTELLFPSCRLLSTIIGQPIGSYSPIIGNNAFAHESGIHQDGMLKNRLTYEIMTPASVGRKGTDIVIGKHSGRHALKSKVEELGYNLRDDQLGAVFEAVKVLADKKEHIFDEDVEALILENVFRMSDKYVLKDLIVTTGTGSIPPNAALCMEVDKQEKKLSSFGVGPIDAVFNAVNELTGLDPALERYLVNAITGGTDAQGAVTVRVEDAGVMAVGRGSHEDIITASALAYVNALNRLAKMKEEVRECVTL